ncbi:hypothetical protein L1049_008571 [Liquidambar formosana]|uniref:Apple domain-containing protein n=1 Tax=Liquidambar formosana TaxID=63359 RepID=A0AAP0S9L8_LIQFO
MGRPINSVTRLRVTQLLLLSISTLYTTTWAQNKNTTATQELLSGFTATPDSSISSFQPLLTDSTGSFSLGFLRVNRTQLALSVIHVPSSDPLWVANVTPSARWSRSTRFTFNGSLVISDPSMGVFWSTNTDGDRVSLLNTSNLQIQKLSDPPTVVWQSFYFPTNALVENQNFTSTMSLVSSNGIYSMRLGDDFIGLYAEFNRDTDQIYWKHKALQAKADIVQGQGPIYARVNSNGYLGMYQTGNTPVDVQAFNSFQRPTAGFLLVRLEPDGNLKGYYWDGSKWVLDYQAIQNECELPSPCGSYGLCRPGDGCACIDNRTEYNSGGCSPAVSGDFCGGGEAQNAFSVLRRKGVELPYKELMGFETMSSEEQCEKSCEMNCSCWGAVYNNASGFCYSVDYPIQTLVGVGDETKVGYFKVRKGAGNKEEVGFGVGVGLVGGAVVVSVGLVGFGGYMFWKRKRGIRRFSEEEEGGVCPGPYKDLGSASFRSIELSNR